MRDYDWPYVDQQKLIHSRMGKVNSIMEEEGLDAVLLNLWDDVRYVSGLCSVEYVEGTWEGFSAIMKRGGDLYVYSIFEGGGGVVYRKPYDDKPHIKEIIGLPAVYPFPAMPGSLAKIFGKKLKELGVSKVGIDNLPFETYELLRKELPKVEFKPIYWQLLKTRMIKDDEEIRLIEANCAITDAAAYTGIAAIREGKSTERQIGAILIKALHEYGGELLSHYVVVSTLPIQISIPADHKIGTGDTTDFSEHGRPYEYKYASNKPIVDGEVAKFDIGIYGRGGYATDMMRTAFAGKPSKGLLNAYTAFYEMYFKCLNAVKPGVKVSELDKLCRGYLKEIGYVNYPLIIGHGIGLRICELPAIPTPGDIIEDIKLESNMTICIEFHGGYKGMPIGLEDTILVTDKGHRLLTKTGYSV